MRTRAWLVVALGWTLLSAVPALGQEPASGTPATALPPAAPAPAGAPGSDEAREHFKRGEAAYQKGSYTIAISEWEAAYAKDPRPRIQYNLYQAFERLGQLGEASDALQRYLSTADPDDPSYADATARMTALQQRLQSTGVRLVGGVEGASINVSGQSWGRLPRPDRIPVQPGNHRVVVQLEGYREFTSNVVVPAGQVVDVYIQLEPTGDAAVASDPATSGRTDGSDVSGSDATPFFIGSAVLGAGAISSAVWMLNRNAELDGCDSARFFCENEDAVSTQRTVAIALTAVLGVGAITTLILGLTADGDEQPAQASVRCAPGLLGAACQGRF
jgi:hypothetical protein